MLLILEDFGDGGIIYGLKFHLIFYPSFWFLNFVVFEFLIEETKNKLVGYKGRGRSKIKIFPIGGRELLKFFHLSE